MLFDTDSRVREVLEPGMAMDGAVCEHAVTLLFGGPGGALAESQEGERIAQLFQLVCEDLHAPQMARRERARCGLALAHAVAECEKKLIAGRLPRSSGFFTDPLSVSIASEVLHAVAAASRLEHEERKIPHYAALFATAAFEQRIHPGSVLFVLSMARRMTWRQFCLLHLFSKPQPIPLRQDAYRDPTKGELPVDVLLTEVMSLCQAGLVECQEPGSDEYDVIFAIEQIHPAWMVRSNVGSLMHELMQLKTIDQTSLEWVAELLR